MTREEARQVFLSRGYVEVEGGTIYDADKWRESCRVISEWLEQEPCEDTVSRQAVIKHICEEKFCYKENCKGVLYNRCPDITWVNDLPSVQPTRKKGKWIKHCFSFVNDDCQIVTECHCNKCYGIAYFRTTGGELVGANLCPNCGAEMESEE